MIEYDPHNWVEHLLDVKGSLVKEITPRIFICGVWSILVVILHIYFYPVHIPSTVHSLVGVALGLLLVFRTNSSYDRFWEGRKLWGSIINESRNLGRLCVTFFERDPELLKQMNAVTIAFSYSLMNMLREAPGLGRAKLILSPKQQESIEKAGNLPFACGIELTQTLNEARKRGHISDYIYGILDSNIQLLMDYAGACERIHRTPLPFAYVVHLRRALIFYCYSLPFALVESVGWATPVGIFLVTYIFFGIEEIGVEIEDPFGFDENDLPLEKFCETIEKELIGLQKS